MVFVDAQNGDGEEIEVLDSEEYGDPDIGAGVIVIRVNG